MRVVLPTFMKESNNTIQLKRRISIFDYFRLFIIFAISGLTLKSVVIINLPRDIQYPYLFFDRGRGANFINFAEKLKKLFRLKLYWTNSPVNTFKKDVTSHLTISWDFIPKKINLIVNLKITRERKEKILKLLQPQLKRVNFV